MKEIKLTQGKVTQVDDEDYDFLNQWNWQAKKGYNTFYAVHNQWKISGGIKMHRLLINAPRSKSVDHIDRNGLNNQKSNLRLCNHQQNAGNSLVRSGLKYKGVNYHVKGKYKYIEAQISVNYKKMWLGYFRTEKEAALAYNEAAKKYYGEFANLNII